MMSKFEACTVGVDLDVEDREQVFAHRDGLLVRRHVPVSGVVGGGCHGDSGGEGHA